MADALSRYYETSNDEELHYDEYVSADVRLDKDGDDLPMGRAEEARKLLLMSENHIKRLAVLEVSDERESRQKEADSLNPPDERIGRSDLPIGELMQLPSALIPDSSILLSIKNGYNEDIWQKIISKCSEFKNFEVLDGLLCHLVNNSHSLVIPDVNHKGEGVRGM